MGPSQHGRRVESGGAVVQSSWTSGSYPRRGGGGGGGGRVKNKGPSKGRQMGEKEQESVWDKVIIKGEEDKANWAGRSDNSFVMKP